MEVLELYMTGYQEARLKPTEASLKVGWPLKVASGNNQKATRKTSYDLKGTQLHMNCIKKKKKTKTHNSIIPNRQYQVYLYKDNFGACFSPENPG